MGGLLVLLPPKPKGRNKEKRRTQGQFILTGCRPLPLLSPPPPLGYPLPFALLEPSYRVTNSATRVSHRKVSTAGVALSSLKSVRVAGTRGAARRRLTGSLPRIFLCGAQADPFADLYNCRGESLSWAWSVICRSANGSCQVLYSVASGI